MFHWPHPDLLEQRVYYPRRFFKVTTGAESEPQFVVDEFAHFVVEGGLIYFQFVEA